MHFAYIYIILLIGLSKLNSKRKEWKQNKENIEYVRNHASKSKPKRKSNNDPCQCNRKQKKYKHTSRFIFLKKTPPSQATPTP
jgi:hypothetical protein